MSGKAAFRVGGDEVVLADVCAPLSSLTIPLLELVLITGVAWMAIGVPGAVSPAGEAALVDGVWFGSDMPDYLFFRGHGLPRG